MASIKVGSGPSLVDGRVPSHFIKTCDASDNGNMSLSLTSAPVKKTSEPKITQAPVVDGLEQRQDGNLGTTRTSSYWVAVPSSRQHSQQSAADATLAADSSATQNTTSRNMISNSTIAGVTLGGLALVCGTLIVVALILRRKLDLKMRPRLGAELEGDSGHCLPWTRNTNRYKSGGWGPRELAARRFTPVELPARRHSSMTTIVASSDSPGRIGGTSKLPKLGSTNSAVPVSEERGAMRTESLPVDSAFQKRKKLYNPFEGPQDQPKRWTGPEATRDVMGSNQHRDSYWYMSRQPSQQSFSNDRTHLTHEVSRSSSYRSNFSRTSVDTFGRGEQGTWI